MVVGCRMSHRAREQAMETSRRQKSIHGCIQRFRRISILSIFTTHAFINLNPRQQPTSSPPLPRSPKFPNSHPPSLRPHNPRPIPKLHQLTQPPHKHTIEPKQRKIQQIATPALEPESTAPAFQQLQAFARVVDDLGADEQVQEERGDEGEICAGICEKSKLLVMFMTREMGGVW